MKRLAALLLAVLICTSLPATASAAFAGLRVDGPAGAWRASNVFVAEWFEFNPYPIVYRFVNAPWGDDLKQQLGAYNRLDLQIPTPPGASVPPPGDYLVAISAYEHGLDAAPSPSSFVTLRFDASPPPAPQVSAPPIWFDAGSKVPVMIEPAPGSFAASGIRGYALEVSSVAGRSPCAVADRCSDAELDQPGGPGQRYLALDMPPHGTSYLNVVAVSGAGVSSAVASVPIHVDALPPALRFVGVPAGWVDHPVAVTAIAEDPFSGMAPAGPAGPFTSMRIDGEKPTLALGGAVTATVSGNGIHRTAAWARDAVGNEAASMAASSPTVRIDEIPPKVAFANAQRADDPELIELVVADSLSGPSDDRGSIGIRPAGTSQIFKRLPTQTTAGGLQARWDSDDYPPGSYEFRATGFDAAGNPSVTDRRADGSPMVLQNPVKVPTAIDSGFGGARLVWQRCHRVDSSRRRCERETVTNFDSRPALRTVPYGRSLRFGGVLRTKSGAPLAGSMIEIVETFAPGADLAQRRVTVTSRDEGRFGVRLTPGPSRRVEAFFPGTRTLTRSGGRQVTMAVRAGVRFEASTRTARIGGRPVIFKGRLLADEATIRRTGRPIQLEFRVPGGEWSEFRTVQTDGHGRFRYPYAFSDDDSRGIRFQFRAISPEQADFPYRPAASAPVAVTGY